MPTGTQFGVSIGGAHATTIASQTARYGTLPAVRHFASGSPPAAPAGLTSSMAWIVSFKMNATDYVGMANGVYSSAITTWARGLAAGLKVKACYYHEPENDGFTLAQWKAAAGYFNNLIHTMTGVVATIEPWQIYMYGTLMGWNGRDINNYWDNTWDANHKPAHIGFDFDGGGLTAGSDLSVGISRAQAFATAKGVPWSVPEFGGGVAASDDAGHDGRAAWNTQVANQFAAAGASYVTYYDDGSIYLTQTPEINAWKALVQTVPPTTPSPPTGLTITPASDGNSATLGWAALPGGIDHLDIYVQHPGETTPHRVNTGNVNVTPRAYTFPTVPGGSYLATAACATDSAGTNRSGWTTPFVSFQAPNPGPSNHSPVITQTQATQDATNPLLYHLVGAATDPDGNTLTYRWHFTFPADATVTPPADLTSATGDVTFPGYGGWIATFSATDTGGLTTPLDVPINLTPAASAYTAFANLQMLQHHESVQDMAYIEQQSKQIIDGFLKTLTYRRSPHNVRHNLVASNYDPGNQSGSGVNTPTAKDFWYTTLVMEGDTIAHLQTVTARAQIGTGAFGGVFDTTGPIYPDVDPFSIDAWLAQTLGVISMDLPAPRTNMTPGTPFIFGMWWPATGTVSQYPQFRCRAAGGVQASIGAVGAPIWGVVPNVSAFPTTVNFGSAVTIVEHFIGVPVP